jgi:hypothetical protein
MAGCDLLLPAALAAGARRNADPNGSRVVGLVGIGDIAGDRGGIGDGRPSLDQDGHGDFGNFIGLVAGTVTWSLGLAPGRPERSSPVRRQAAGKIPEVVRGPYPPVRSASACRDRPPAIPSASCPSPCSSAHRRCSADRRRKRCLPESRPERPASSRTPAYRATSLGARALGFWFPRFSPAGKGIIRVHFEASGFRRDARFTLRAPHVRTQGTLGRGQGPSLFPLLVPHDAVRE